MYNDAGDSIGLRGRTGVILALFTLFFIILLGRLFYVQILRGDDYRAAALTSFVMTERLPATRGEIKDRNGVVLARNVPVHQLILAPKRLLNSRKSKTEPDPEYLANVLNAMTSTLEMTFEEEELLREQIQKGIDGTGPERLIARERLVGQTCPFDGADLILPDPADTSYDVSEQLYCRSCGLHHEGIAHDAVFCPHDRTRLQWVGEGTHRHASCNKCKRSYVSEAICPNDGSLLQVKEKNLGCPVCKRRFTNEVAVIEGKIRDIRGLSLDVTVQREYTQPFNLSHLLGYMNRVSAADIEKHPGVYHHEDKVGRSGLEAALEPILRGQSGYVKYLRGTERSVENERKRSESGQDVWLTIDARLQREVREILRYQRSAAAVVMDPMTGEILAMYSHPGFDPNAWSQRLSREEYQEINQNPYAPMFNKAVTAYAPGSVFKIVTSLAALREGIVTPDTIVNCPGYYHYGGRDFRCHARQGHGYVDLVGALKGSCDVYYYQIAERLGMDKIAEYARKFGYGELTGIEVAEAAGIVPTRAWYASKPHLKYQPGLALSVAIGQGSLTASPLQVTRSFAILINGGKLIKPRLVSRYTDALGVNRQDFMPVYDGQIDMTREEQQLLHKGLLAVVNAKHGTATSVKDSEITIAGKTGTAEAAMTRPGASPEFARWLLEDHAWFTMYAPAEDPQVVITVFVEHGGGGSREAAPLARRIFDSWKRLGLYRNLPEPIEMDFNEDEELKPSPRNPELQPTPNREGRLDRPDIQAVEFAWHVPHHDHAHHAHDHTHDHHDHAHPHAEE